MKLEVANLIEHTTKLVKSLTALSNLLLEQLREETELARREWPTDQ